MQPSPSWEGISRLAWTKKKYSFCNVVNGFLPIVSTFMTDAGHNRTSRSALGALKQVFHLAVCNAVMFYVRV